MSINVPEFSCSDRCAVASHGYFNLHFPDDMMWGIFSYAYLPSVYLCYDFKVLVHFFIQVVWLRTVEF